MKRHRSIDVGELATIHAASASPVFSGLVIDGRVMLDPKPPSARLQDGTLTTVLASAPSVSGITYTPVVAVDGLVGWVLGERVRKLA